MTRVDLADPRGQQQTEDLLLLCHCWKAISPKRGTKYSGVVYLCTSSAVLPLSLGSMAEQQYDHITQHVYNRIARNQVRRHQRSQQAAFWTAQRAFEASNVAAKCQDSRAASQDKQGRRQGKDRAQSSCKADVHHNGQETDVNGASPKFTAEDARLGLDEDAMDEDEVLRSMTEDSGIYNGQTSPSPAQPTSQCTSHERNREREQEQERADAVRQMREVLDRQQAQRAAEERLRETAWSADQEEGVSSVDINGDHIMGEGSLDPAGTFSSNFKRHINKLRQSEVRKAAARRAQQKQWEEEQRREQEEQQRREREEQQRREQEEQQHWEREEQQRREQEEQQRREREEQQHREWEQQQQREREQQQRREWERERERQEYASMTPLEVGVEFLH